jgi:glycosyltransferase involved in cell wall biosynthesis
MPLPKFSIVTPSLNQATYLEQNIKSVLAQNYPSTEHIIIDGGSQDGTIEILKRYPHLVWSSEPDRGQAAALNKGFRKATGEIIGWLNADDTYLPDIFHLVARSFEVPENMVSFGDANEVDGIGNILRARKSRGVSSENLIRYWWWSYEYTQSAFFFRRSAFDEIGMLDEDLFYVMDHEFFIRLSLRYPFTYIPAKLANYRLHPASKTGKVSGSVIPDSVWELHRVSRRHWGRPGEWKFYSHALSFVGGLLLSFGKNLFFRKDSKSRSLAERLLGRTVS